MGTELRISIGQKQYAVLDEITCLSLGNILYQRWYPGGRRCFCLYWRRSGELRTGKRGQKSEDIVDFFVLQFLVQLQVTHLINCLRQVAHLAVMEIWGGKGDIAQHGNLEDIFVTFKLGDLKASRVLVVAVLLEYAHFLEGHPPQVGAAVALHAANIDEGAHPFHFFSGEGLFVS